MSQVIADQIIVDFDSSVDFKKVVLAEPTPHTFYPALHALPNIFEFFGKSDLKPTNKQIDTVLIYFWSPQCGLWDKYSPMLAKFFFEYYQTHDMNPPILLCDPYQYRDFTKIFPIDIRLSPMLFVAKKFDFSGYRFPEKLKVYDLCISQTLIGADKPQAIEELIDNISRYTAEDFLSSGLFKNYKDSLDI